MKLSKKSKIYGLVLLGVTVFFLLANYLKNNTDTNLVNAKVVLTAKVPKDDVFQFFYWESPSKAFSIKNSVKTKVKGSEDYQEITFVLPPIEDLFRIRLDIGENFDQQPITIKKLIITDEEGTRTFDLPGFNRLFAGNKYISQTRDGRFSGIVGNSKDRAIYDPYFISVDDSKEMDSIRINRFTKYPYLISAFSCLVIFLFIGYNFNKISISPKGIFAAVFLVLLVIPVVQNRIQLTPPLENLEKRQLATKPDFSFSTKFARDYEDYFDDNFGLRNHMVNWGGSYRTKLFRSSIHPELVKFGKDKWLFYNKMKSRMYRSYSRDSLLSQGQIKWMVDQWTDRRNRYTASGRKYFLSFWPNKHTIYPEYMPNTMKIQVRDTLSRVDQLLGYMQKNGVSTRLTDPRPTLLEGKEAFPVYHKFDSHWNSYGAFLAYQHFFDQNAELGMSPKSVNDFDIVWKDYSWGEHIQLLGVRNKGFFIEKNPTFALKENKNQIQYLPIDGFPKLTVITKNEHSGNKLRALVFRDSFTNKLIPFFSLHFYEVYYIWGYHEQYVNQLNPDIIIEGFVEREMGEKIPQ